MLHWLRQKVRSDVPSGNQIYASVRRTHHCEQDYADFSHCIDYL